VAGELGLYCVTCGKQTLHRSAGAVNHVLHFLITFFTCGLWAIVWIILAVGAGSAGHLCTVCGTFYDATRIPGYQPPPVPLPRSGPPSKGARTVVIVLVSIGGLALLGAIGVLAYLHLVLRPRAEAAAAATPSTTLSRMPLAVRAPEQMAGLPEEKRRIVLQGTVTSTGENCVVTRTFLQGTRYGDAYWNVACSNGKAFVVKVADDAKGSTRVLDCAVVKAMGDRCFTKFQ
jgi:hypothetical protein